MMLLMAGLLCVHFISYGTSRRFIAMEHQMERDNKIYQQIICFLDSVWLYFDMKT